jgi:4-hydroxy-tetrahydrodipicolinate synthase
VKIQGLIPPALTPMRTDYEVDVPAIARLASYLVGGGADAIFVLGTTGEGPNLTCQQRVRTVAAFAEATPERIPVLAGLGEASVERSIEMIEALTEAGADALVVTAPYYFGELGDRAVAAHLRQLATSAALPVVIYNIPGHTHNPIAPPILDEIAQIPNVVAVKDSGGDWSVFETYLRIGHTHGLAVLQGSPHLAARSLLAGADGIVPGIANLVPRLARELIDAALTGNEEKATQLQARLDTVLEIESAGYWLAALKSAAHTLGLCGETLSRSLPTLAPGERSRLDRLLPVVVKEAGIL